MARTFLVEIGCRIAGVQSTLRYSWEVTRGYQTRPSDTPASEPYHPRLRECVFGYDVSGDQIRLGSGRIVLNNGDAALDAILDYVYDSQIARLFIVDPLATYSTAIELARWAVEQPSDGDRVVTIVTRSPTYNLDRSMQTVRYGGTGGLDGGPELANKPKPLPWGPVLNARATLVDPPKLIYELGSAHGLSSIAAPGDASNIAVYDEGLAMTRGADYTSVAQMNSTAPAGGDDYRVCPASVSGSTNQYATYIRLQSNPLGEELTYSGRFFPAGGVLAGNTLQALVLAATGSSSGIYGADHTRLFSVFDYDVGLFFGSDGEPATFLDALKQILIGMRGWLVPYQAAPTQIPVAGLDPPWAVRWLDTPATATPSPYKNDVIDPGGVETTYLTIDGSRIAPRTFTRRAEYEFGWPEFRTTLMYERLAHRQTTGLAATVALADRARLALEYLSASDEDAAVKTGFPTAVDRVLRTAWMIGNGVGLAPIGDEATRQLDVFKDPHPAFDVSARVDLYHGALTVPGDPADIVNYARHGCDVSRTFLILGMHLDYLAFDQGANTIGFQGTIWG